MGTAGIDWCIIPCQLCRFDLQQSVFLTAYPVVVGHGSQSMMGLSIDSSSVAMNLRTVRISKSKKIQLQELEITKVEVSPFLVI